MAYWLAKTEPDEYSYTDLEQLGRDKWNGVRNFVALKHMRQMQVGDLVFIYHTGKVKAIIGVAEVVAPAYPDPNAEDARYIVVEFAPCYRLTHAVTLKDIKTVPTFADWELVRQPRLSVMPVKEEYWRLVHKMAT